MGDLSESELENLVNVSMRVNGVEVRKMVKPRRLLVQFLREDLGLTGTHIGCIEGRCGACTVLVDGVAVKSCMMFAVQVDGAEILTIEGLEKDGHLHPLQEAFNETHALQCGYCTPGMIMSAHELLTKHRAGELSDEVIMEEMSGNLCRCTGYYNIVRAIKLAAERMERGK